MTAAALKNSALTAVSVVRIKKQVVSKKAQHNGHPSLYQNFNANVPTLQNVGMIKDGSSGVFLDTDYFISLCLD